MLFSLNLYSKNLKMDVGDESILVIVKITAALTVQLAYAKWLYSLTSTLYLQVS